MNQYVQTRPSDRFTKLVPFYEFKWKKVDARSNLLSAIGLGHGDGYIAILHMPHLTPYNRTPFIGYAYTTKYSEYSKT